MSHLHVVLVTLYGQFTISVEQDKSELVTLNTVFSVVCIYIYIFT